MILGRLVFKGACSLIFKIMGRLYLPSLPWVGHRNENSLRKGSHTLQKSHCRRGPPPSLTGGWLDAPEYLSDLGKSHGGESQSPISKDEGGGWVFSSVIQKGAANSSNFKAPRATVGRCDRRYLAF